MSVTKETNILIMPCFFLKLYEPDLAADERQ